MRRSFVLPTFLVAAAAWLLSGAAEIAPAQSANYLERSVLYGVRNGVPLLMDVARPDVPNGAAILSIQSGGWHSKQRDSALIYPARHGLLAKGYTVFVIWHANPPRSTVPETVSDIQRAVRFIHANADRWNVDPKRLAAMGGSSAGHLSIMLAIGGDDGDPTSSDPVAKASSRIATAIAINAPTDLRGWTTQPPAAIAAMDMLKAPLNFDAKLEASVSPVTLVDPKDAPILLIHGSADELVPIQHSENLLAAMKAQKVGCILKVIQGGGHNLDAKGALETVGYMADWLAKYLPPQKP